MGWVVGIIVAAIIALVGITVGPDIKRYFRLRRM
jgi:hypothetical protein